MRRVFVILLIVYFCGTVAAREPVDCVNPFVGSTNFGTTNPGAVAPNGMMSVVPFNVMGSELNKYDKDARWWSTPYEYHNKFFTGYSHVNLSGVGCPELGSLLLMPTSGQLCVDYREYGSEYTNQTAIPGYYSNLLTKYNVKTEVSATPRTSIARFTFPKGESNILLNLGEGLTNESGAFARKVSPTEIEGMKVLGTFCYNAQAVFPIYFVMRLSKAPRNAGYWKKQRTMSGVEAEWDRTNGKYKLYTKYNKEIAGDDIGAYFSFDTSDAEQIEVQIGVSFVSIENARLNLDTEQPTRDFDKVCKQTRESWNSDLSRIKIEGGTEQQQSVFYTALYHTLIHPNTLQDVNGEYPAMEGDQILTTDNDRYTVFSLWDTYRNLHQLLTLVYPERQRDMVRTMIEMYKEHGWLPKWELYGRETLTMEGDPSIAVIVDTWLKGVRGFDINVAYEAMRKSATTKGSNNLMRPDNDDYTELGYVALRKPFDNSVSHALEYYIADYALSILADSLGKKDDAALFRRRSMGYKNYFCKEFGMMRPKLPNGEFYKPFNPMQGENFEPSPGFHEGNAWNYTFYVPHDVYGLAELMGGQRKFTDKLQMVFDKGLYDPANEPDIAYPYLFSYFKAEAWRTQKEVARLLKRHFTTEPDGIPGNDDTGTMSAWAIFSMMGFYPDCAGVPSYTLTSPTFDKVTITLNPEFYRQKSLTIEAPHPTPESIYIKSIKLSGKPYNDYRISHKQLVEGGKLSFDIK